MVARTADSGHLHFGGVATRGGRILVVTAVHLIAIYAVAAGLGVVEAPQFVQPIKAQIIDAPREDKPVEPMKPDPQLAEPTLDVPLPQEVPEIPVEVPVEVVPQNPISTTPAQPVETAQMQVTSRVEPVYPPASRRAGEEGTGTYRVLVDERGRPTEVTVLRSSGHARLDEAAIDAIRRWVFAPAMRNSQRVPSWTRVQVTFQLR